MNSLTQIQIKIAENIDLIQSFKESVSFAYEAAKRARAGMVRLAPQYRKKDKYNAEGEFLQRIKFCMSWMRTSLSMIERLEKENEQMLLNKND